MGHSQRPVHPYSCSPWAPDERVFRSQIQTLGDGQIPSTDYHQHIWEETPRRTAVERRKWTKRPGVDFLSAFDGITRLESGSRGSVLVGQQRQWRPSSVWSSHAKRDGAFETHQSPTVRLCSRQDLQWRCGDHDQETKIILFFFPVHIFPKLKQIKKYLTEKKRKRIWGVGVGKMSNRREF